MSPRIIIAGGGTGGHIFPAVAIGRALQAAAPGTELLFVGARGKMEMEKIPQEGYKIVGLDIAGFNRSALWKNWSLPFKVMKSAMQASGVIRSFRPDAVVGVGGFASFPVLNAAQRVGIPTLIQEQNSFAGKSNRILAKRAAAVCVAYAGMERFFPADRLQHTGNPVRKTISHSRISREEGQAWLGLHPDKKTVLVVGGSLGAKSINEAIDAGLESLLAEGVQVIWQTGKPYHAQALQRASGFSDDVRVFDFIREMEYAYAAADFVISRAGALAIAELCIVAKPVIFVPYPHAAEDHQTSNAAALTERGAALMVKDSDARIDLIKKLKALLQNEAQQAIMHRALQQLAIPDADDRIANLVLQLAGKSTPSTSLGMTTP